VHRDGLISGTNSNTVEERVEVGEHATNPEEILGAVDARCVTMSLVSLRTEMDCTISRMLSGAEITLDASNAAG
jgi:organic hydroperoxide reductase OsmC/OhrA